METFLDGRIKVIQGDITKLRVQAVVNAANSSLLGGGGVDGAIHRAGGPAVLEACRKIRNTDLPEGLPPGNAVITTAGSLPAEYVVHTVGPVWHGGNSGEAETLSNAYRSSLGLMTEYGLETAAFPAISTGVYGFPKKKAAEIALEAIRTYLASHALPREVSLVFFSAADMQIFLDAVRE